MLRRPDEMASGPAARRFLRAPGLDHVAITSVERDDQPDGGYMSWGNATGAVGLAGLAEVVWQLRGEAGPRQVKGAKVALDETLGAEPTFSVTILSN